MDKQTRLLILREVIRQSEMRHQNMKSAIKLGIIDFKNYQDEVEKIVENDINTINKLEIKNVR